MIRDILFFDECKLLTEKSLRSNLNFDFDGEIQVMWSQWCTCRLLEYFSETWFSYRNTLKAPSWTCFPYWLSQVCGFGLGWVMYTNWKQSLNYMNLHKKKQSSYQWNRSQITKNIFLSYKSYQLGRYYRILSMYSSDFWQVLIKLSKQWKSIYIYMCVFEKPVFISI